MFGNGGFLVWLCVVVVRVSAQCDVRAFANDGHPNPAVPYGTPSAQALVLWVTSLTYTGGELGGLSGLDAMCTATQPTTTNTVNGFVHQNQARVALVSNSTRDAIDRIPANYDIVNSKGECLDASASFLFSDSLDLSYLLLDETGSRLPSSQTGGSGSAIYTGTKFTGLRDGTSPSDFCDDWASSSSAFTASIGTILDNPSQGNPSQWINSGQPTTCDHKYHIYCISAAPAPTPTPTSAPTNPDAGGAGDPQFVGLQGQTFQVHGIPDEYFNLLSHPFTQLNSHFTYLATGTCNYNDTLCWSHPGTYVDELGVMLPGVHVGVRAGTHAQGLVVTINGKVMRVPGLHMHSESVQTPTHTRSSKGQAAFTATFPIQLDNETIASPHNAWLEPPEDLDMSGSSSPAHADSASAPWYSWLSSATVRVSFHSHNRVVIHTPVASIDIYNAEHFFNFQLELRAPRLLLAGARVHRVLGSQSQSQSHSPHPNFPMHGIVGQTWKNVRYPNGRLYSGQVDDYMLTDRTLFSTQFHFNEYLY